MSITKQTYQTKCVTYGSLEQQATIQLRDDILRKPLGLQFTKEQLAAESEQIHIACFEKEELVGCLILVPIGDKRLKMRQVAVKSTKQHKGIGRTMSNFCEAWAKKHKYQTIYCHARAVAVPFYEKLGYKKYGELFQEVGIDHWKMEKVV